MLHTAAELRDRAKECRDRASKEIEADRKAQLVELASNFEEAAEKIEEEGTFEDGYEQGWSSIAGTDAQPDNPTQPFPREERTPDKGYIYGRSDAKDASKS